MPAVLVIAAKDVRQRFRDRSAVVVGFVAPLLIATLMSFAFQGADEVHVTLAVVDLDHGAVATSFLDLLRSDDLHDLVTVRRVGAVDTARRQVDDGDVGAAVVLPTGFTAAVSSTTAAAPTLQVLATVDQPIAEQVARALASSFVAQINADRLSVATALAAGAPPAALPTLAADAARSRLPVAVRQETPNAEQLQAVSYFAPAMAIFFLLFAVGFTSRSFFGERTGGTLDRMAIAPVRPTTVLLGKALSIVVFGLASLTTMAVVTTVAFGADWGAPPAALAVGLAMVLAVVALTSLVIAVSRTQRQAEGLASIGVFTLSLLGGNFMFVGAAPPLMRRLALLTPNGWAMRAFTDVATTSGGWTHDLGLVAGPVAAMLAITAVIGGVAALCSRRVIVR